MSASLPEVKPGTLRSKFQVLEVGLLVPWPRCCPWVLISAGVAIGFVVGFTPWLFLLIGVFCLLSGLIVKA